MNIKILHTMKAPSVYPNMDVIASPGPQAGQGVAIPEISLDKAIMISLSTETFGVWPHSMKPLHWAISSPQYMTLTQKTVRKQKN